MDALEADVDRVEALIADDHRVRDLPPADPWSPPEGLGPLPLDLRPRADAILSRQIAATQALAIALVANRRQAEAASRIEAGDAPRRPAYLDCAV
nr:hypothetical protein [Planosporangium mesophilum]